MSWGISWDAVQAIKQTSADLAIKSKCCKTWSLHSILILQEERNIVPSQSQPPIVPYPRAGMAQALGFWNPGRCMHLPPGLWWQWTAAVAPDPGSRRQKQSVSPQKGPGGCKPASHGRVQLRKEKWKAVYRVCWTCIYTSYLLKASVRMSPNLQIAKSSLQLLRINNLAWDILCDFSFLPVQYKELGQVRKVAIILRLMDRGTMDGTELQLILGQKHQRT